ncbi:MAG: 50S ribosomal protein L21 [Pseudomonas fluorescens]|nr:MAG: 50S ribosomal protein L21 [Pseudomonas fluorescens]
MYAIVMCGGKQLKVAQGEHVSVELLNGDVGSKVVLDKVLLVADGDKISVGSPLLANAKVNAEVVSHGKGKKVIIFKKRRRQNSRRKNGHRQSSTMLKITGISL